MNKTIVITGATGGLGNLAAQTFAARGDNLALLDYNQDSSDALSRSLNLPARCIYAQSIDLLADGALHDSAKKIAAKFGYIHALVHLITGGEIRARESCSHAGRRI